MQRPIYFCEGWFSAKKYAPEIWTEAQAQAAHDSGQKYTVLVDSIERPFCIIDVMTSKFIGVDFLDEHLREALTYQFQLASPGQMFLTMAVHREFDGEEDKVARASRYTFTEDGKLQIRRTEFIPEHSQEVADGEADVTSHYVAVPEFGHYEAFMKMER